MFRRKDIKKIKIHTLFIDENFRDFTVTRQESKEYLVYSTTKNE